MFTKIKKLSRILLPILILGLLLTPFIVSAQEESSAKSCGSWRNIFCHFMNALGNVGRLLLEGMLGLAAIVTWAAGSLLDLVIKITVTDMSANISSISGIDIAWTTMRDVANVFFIFILLYAAVGTVLQLGINTRRVITRVIIIALLVNFSLFFTKVIIDISNTVSITFYNAITETAPFKGASAQTISGAYMDKLLLTTLYKDDKSGKPAVDLLENPAVAFMGSLFFIIAALVFLATAVLFIVRYVLLIFVMILSAPAFVAMALPNDSYSEKWWKTLFSQAIFAPVFFILAWITLQVLEGVLGTLGTNNPSLATAITGSADSLGNKTADPGAVAIFANFGIAITFMVASLAVARSLAGNAGKGLQKYMGRAAGMVMGGAAFIGRGTIGRTGASFLQSDRAEILKDKAARGDIGARLQLQAAASASRSSFDVRKSKLTQGASGFAGLDLGKASGKDGYSEVQKQQLKRVEESSKLFKPSDTAIDQAERKIETIKRQKQFVDDLVRQQQEASVGGDSEKARALAEKVFRERNKLNSLGTVEQAKEAAEKLKGAGKERMEAKAERIEKTGFLSGLAFGNRKVRAANFRKLSKGKSKEKQIAEAAMDIVKAEQQTAESEGAPTPAQESQGGQGEENQQQS